MARAKRGVIPPPEPEVDESRLLHLIVHALAKGGPVHALMRREYPGAAHRPAQAKAGFDLCVNMNAGRLRLKAKLNATVALQEIYTGVGKTLDAALAAAFYAAETGNRAMISVVTKADRQAVKALEPLVNEVLKLTYAELGLTPKRPLPIRFAERIATSSFISPSRVAELKAEAENLAPNSPMALLMKKFVLWCEETDPADRTFQEWYAFHNATMDSSEEGTDDALPKRLEEDDLRLRLNEEDEDFRAKFDKALQPVDLADVVIVTHAMLMYNSLYRGRILRTTTGETRQFGTLIVDEADRLPDVANATRRIDLNYLTVRRRLDDLAMAVKTKAIVLAKGGQKVLQDAVNTWLAFNEFLRNDHSDGTRVINTRDVSAESLPVLFQARVAQKVIPAFQALINALPEKGALIARDQFTDVISRLETFCGYVDETRDKLVVNISGRSCTISHEVANNTRLIRSLWLGNEYSEWPRRHSFESIYFMSGTMLDLNDSMHDIEMSLGLDNTDLVHVMRPTTIKQTMGRISNFFIPITNIELEPFLKSGEGYQINPKHISLVCDAIEHGAASGEQGLVICGSYSQRNAVTDELKRRGLANLLISRDRHQSREAMIADFGRRKGSIYVGIERMGVNFVNPETGQTIPKYLVLTRILRAPSSVMGIHRYRGVVGSNDHERHEAYRNCIQAIGRMFRNPGDVASIYIIDPRWPLPRGLDHLRVKLDALGVRPNKAYAQYEGFRNAPRQLPERTLRAKPWNLGILRPGEPPVIFPID